MRTFRTTTIAILSGIIFLCGGVSLANAAAGDTAAQTPVTSGSYRADKTYWAYTWRVAPGLVGTIGNIVTRAGDQPAQYAVSLSKADCESAYTSNTAGNILLSPCTEYTGAQLNTLTAQAMAANQQFTDKADRAINAVKNPYDITCWTAIPPSIDIGGCIALVSYYIYVPTGFLILTGGAIFDSVLVLSIDPTWLDQGFINTAWEILRNFSNMAFIFVLLYIGFKVMLGDLDFKRPVFNIIVVAIFINFSLFATKLIIDAGNILAVGIYEQIGSPQNSHLPCPSTTRTCISERGVSGNIASGVQLQKILSADVANSLGDKGPLSFVFLAGAAMNLMLFWIFFRVSYLFVARLVKFWELLIVSPIAFLSTAIPGMNEFASEWINTLMKQAFLAPVFLFYVYVILMIFDTGFFNSWITPSTVAEKGYSGILLSVFLSGIIVFVALTKALELAESWSGSAGQAAKKYIGGALGFGAGKAMGGWAELRRRTKGKNADTRYKNEERELRERISKGGIDGWRAQQRLDKLDKLRTSSFDMRENKTAGMVFGELGLSSVGTPETGGYKGAQSKKKENQKRLDEMERKEARVPQIEKQIAAINKEVDDISTNNNNLKGDALANKLKVDLDNAKQDLDTKEENAVQNPNSGQAQVEFLRAKRTKTKVEENLKRVMSASDDIEKLQKQLDEYKK